MFDKVTEKIITNNLLISLPLWMCSVEDKLVFKDLANSFIKYISCFSQESRNELIHVYDNFLHFVENDPKMIQEKLDWEKNTKIKEKEKQYKSLYLKHLQCIIER